MAEHGSRSQGDGRLIAELLRGQTTEAAAKAAGVSLRTAYRRTADPAFQREFAAARTRALGRAVAVLVDSTHDAAHQLAWLASHAQQEAIQLAACRSILELSLKGTELLDVAERLTALEARVVTPAAPNGRARVLR
jgi:hypothetical protein